MGVWTRERDGTDLSGLIYHSDRGVQYGAIRYSERLGEVDVVASVGSVGDSYDNAMAEAFNSLFKAELTEQGPVGRHQPSRNRRRGVHRLVQPPPLARRDRHDPAGRAQSQPPGPATRRGVRTQPPPNPALTPGTDEHLTGPQWTTRPRYRGPGSGSDRSTPWCRRRAFPTMPSATGGSGPVAGHGGARRRARHGARSHRRSGGPRSARRSATRSTHRTARSMRDGR